jgi:hypothetical protein
MGRKHCGLEKIVSGGQTGVDRAALDAAAKAGIRAGGWCPRGRLAEDGPIAPSYPLIETPSEEYDVRTKWNVRDSAGTLIISPEPLSGGTLLTSQIALEFKKPLLIVHPSDCCLDRIRQWIELNQIKTLNVAGPRESQSKGIYNAALSLLTNLLQDEPTVL